MPNNKSKLIKFSYLTATLFVLWLLLSGFFNSLQISLGLISCLLVSALTWRLQILPDSAHMLGMWSRLARYLPWFTWAVIKSNWDVSKLIWQKTMPLSPVMLTIKATQNSEIGLAILANSITLTPGTLTVEAEAGRLEVHALTAALAADLETGEMDKRVSQLEGKL